MASDLYVFDLVTFNWEKIPASPEDEMPRARYFHSADTCKFYIVCLRPEAYRTSHREQSVDHIWGYEQQNRLGQSGRSVRLE